MFNFRTVHGPDISLWQDNNETPQKMDFTKTAEQGGLFVIIKASQGLNQDQDYYDNMENAKNAGLYRGAYHFADSNWGSARDQAQNFWNTIKDDPGEIPPTLDFEARNNIGLSFIKYFLEYIDAKFNENKEEKDQRPPMLYTGLSYWNELQESNNAIWVLKYPLWIAYPDTKLASPVVGIPLELMAEPKVPNVWEKYSVVPVFWQYTWVGDGKLYGAESKGLDLNLFNGDINTFIQFCGDNNGLPGTPPPTGKRYAKITSYYLRIRNAPNFEQKKTLIVENGEELEILEDIPVTNGIPWYRVRFPASYGISESAYMSAVSTYSKVIYK